MNAEGPASSLSLLVRRKVRGTPEAVFRAWTDPEQVMQWWGPNDVHCSECAIELRVGGGYRIANRLPDQSILWISGEFLRVEPPSLIEYTWQRGLDAPTHPDLCERVTVRFTAAADLTEVSVTHSRVTHRATYESHEYGWEGCLQGLANFLDRD